MAEPFFSFPWLEALEKVDGQLKNSVRYEKAETVVAYSEKGFLADHVVFIIMWFLQGELS